MGPRLNRIPSVAVALAAAALLWAGASAADAHPMGNFSISHHATLRAEGGELRVRYRVDLAEIAAAQEMASLDLDGDNAVSDAEREGYLSRLLPQLAAGQSLTVDGQPVKLSAQSSSL